MDYRYFDIEGYVRLVESFHGYKAPGIIIGGFMVNLALRYLPEGTLFNAISETPACLPDAIQLLTKCTVGNNRLKILNFGRFALALYDKDEGKGYRVSLDSEKVDRWSEIRTWFFKLKSKAEQNTELLIFQIKEAKETLCEMHPIHVRPEFLKKEKRGEIVICPCCQEAYPAKDGEVCRGCQGESPYTIPESSGELILTIRDLKSREVR
jgi:formylmethanofuran dehydrogenase subunit E